MVFKVTVSPDLIGGDVDEGYGKVADAFRRNMVSGHEVGAAVAVTATASKSSICGAVTDGTNKVPWEEDTVVNMFSTTKGVASLAIAVAAAQALISYDAEVAGYWPEFARRPKTRSLCCSCYPIRRGCPSLTRP